MGLLRWHALCAEIPALEDMQTQNNLQSSSSSSYIAGNPLFSVFLLLLLVSLSVFLRRSFARVYVFLLRRASALMPTTVASLEKSLQQLKPFGLPVDDVDSSSSSDHVNVNRSPRQWEQCLDLKTGGMYYVNWEVGAKRKAEPAIGFKNLDLYLKDEEEEEYDYESCYTSEASSECSFSSNEGDGGLAEEKEGYVLVVGGCQRCLMYFMVPKMVDYCPKCSGHLLRF